MTQTLLLPFHTRRLNELLGHWRVAAARKAADRNAVGMYARAQGITPASGKRRITLTVILGPRQRGGDVDCFWKSLLDSLKACNLIVDDNRTGVEIMPVVYERGPKREMRILLEETA